MDPVAHSLLGATLAETRLRQLTPLAPAALIVGANAPDIDAFAHLWDFDTALLVRRGWTHGVLALVVLPLLLSGVLLLWDRLVRRRRRPEQPPARFAPLLGLAFLATLTHPLLDWLNTYGIRLWMPFDGRWLYGDTLFIVDPWFWLLMGATVVLARSRSWGGLGGWLLLGGLMTLAMLRSELVPAPARVLWSLALALLVGLRIAGVRRERLPRLAWLCLGLLLAYVGAMYTGGVLARREARSWLDQRGLRPHEVYAGPFAVVPHRRDVIAVLPERYLFLEIDLLADQPSRESHPPVAIEPPDEVVRAALDAPSVRGMVNWLRYPSWQVERLEDGWRVTLLDQRYARWRDAGIGRAVVELDAELRPRAVGRSLRPTP